MTATPATTDFVGDLRKRFQLSQEALARLLSVSLRTVARWEKGRVVPDPVTRERLDRLAIVFEQVAVVLPSSAIPRWLMTPIGELKYCTPLDMLGSEFGTQALQDWIQSKTGVTRPQAHNELTLQL